MNPQEENSIAKQAASEAFQLLPRAYDDLIKPPAQELGKGLLTIAKTLNIALSPLAALVWSFDRLKAFLEQEVARKLEERKTKVIVTPAPSVAVPALMALTYLGGESELRELFANLLVSATDAETAAKVHPVFVEIIKQVSADEARVLACLRKEKYFPCICEGTYNDKDGSHDAHSMFSEISADFNRLCLAAGVKAADETGHYLDNLLRLRLFEIREVADVEVNHSRDLQYSETGISIELERTRYEALYVTKLGIRFLELCVCPTNLDSTKEAPPV